MSHYKELKLSLIKEFKLLFITVILVTILVAVAVLVSNYFMPTQRPQTEPTAAYHVASNINLPANYENP